MKTKCLLLLAWAMPLFLNAQITMTQGDFPSIGDVLVDAVDTLADTLDIGMPGPNQNWDFSGLQEGIVTVTSVIDPDTTALAADFPNANVGFETEGFIAYGNISSDSIILLGSAVDFGMGPTSAFFDPHSKLYELPLQFGNTFTDDYVIQSGFPGFPPLVDSIRFTQTTHRDVTVDGWGQVTTPVGIYDALRIKVDDSTTSVTEFLVGGVWTVQPGADTALTIEYEWLAKETMGPAVAVVFDEMGNLSTVSYSKLGGGGTPVAAFSEVEVNPGVYQFTDLSTNTPDSWMWDFGDGNTSTEQNPLHDFGGPGTYTVCLIAGNSVGQDTLCKEITITFLPVASFTYMDQGNGTVQFNDESSNAPNNWFWDFGDGNVSIEQNPEHTFTASSDYNVCLIVSNLAGSDTTCQSVNISLGAAPIAAFSYADDLMGTLDFMDMTTNNPTSWLWDFGDGNTSTDQNPSHTYASPGIYTVCLVVGNSIGMDTTCQTISVNFLPVAAFSFIDDMMGTLSFMDMTQNNPISWLWDFGDGNTSTDQNPMHTYTVSGDYTICLIVSNMAGSDTTCQMVTISLGGAPIAAFSYTDDLMGNFNFMDLTTNNPTSWSWDFGDGNTSTDQNPIHTYAAPGDYTVCLVVGNSVGMDTVCQMISVNFLPIAAFSFTDDLLGTLNFMDMTTNSPTSWSWDFGDGNTSTDQNPMHTYAAPGDYTACLMVGNVAGMDTTCQTIAVGFRPIAAFSFADDMMGMLTFTDESTNNPTSWSWDFGDSNTSTEQNPVHTYTTPNLYNICLTAANNVGADTVCMEIDLMFTSVSNAFAHLDLEVYPNPTSTLIQFKLEGISEPLELVIRNAMGQNIYQSAFEKSQIVNVMNWSSGIYWYQLKTKEGTSVANGKVVVQD